MIQDNILPDDGFVQCPNCDYICKRSQLSILEGKLKCCPSCSNEFCEGYGDDADWHDPHTWMSDEQIQAQLDWQKELLEKGIVQALIDNHLKKPDEQSKEQSGR
jgi:hypothetical protein